MGYKSQPTSDWVRAHLVLLGTDGCHLCHEALQIIESAIGHLPPEVDIIDLPEVAYQLLEIRIPVLYRHVSSTSIMNHLAMGGLDEAHCLFWPFQQADVCAFINR